MFLAGHETTATALGWMLYHLATHPDIQLKLKTEVDIVLKGNLVTSDSIREVRTFWIWIVRKKMVCVFLTFLS